MLDDLRKILELADEMERLASSTSDVELFERIKAKIDDIRDVVGDELNIWETNMMREYQRQNP